ncbi:MAG: hypothetical protein WAX14_17630 [Rhodococcus sp. (in: high G+C Gram-positive bacteria)]|uniref:Ppx/GppA phosphatase family protein n=1 Tax=Rhodococcus sp. TaxID=1831 RepID=UPI003BB4BCFF
MVVPGELIDDAVVDAPPLPVHAIRVPTRLADEVQPDGSLSVEGVDRAANAVATALEAAYRYEVDRLFPFVTAAIRDAENRDAVLERIVKASGVRPEYLSGDQEARLTYLAVHAWYGWSAGRLLVLDIGGGSMELALGRNTDPDIALSLPLGANRLTRRYLDSDPPTPKELKRMRRDVRDTLGDASDRLKWEGDPHVTVGASKTFKQLARLTGSPAQRKGPFVTRTLQLDQLHGVIDKLAGMPAKDRSGLSGVSESRARQVVAGAIVAECAMVALGLESLDISPWALREGIVLRHLSSITDDCDALPLQVLPPRPQEGATVTTLPQQI